MASFMSEDKNAPVQIGPWPGGMNNRQADHALPAGTVRNAVNTDVDSAGWLRRRAGYTRVLAGVNTRGGYSCPLGTYFVQGSKLFRLNDDDSSTELCDGILGGDATYEYFNGTVYFSDGRVTKRITAAGAGEWGLDVPATPSLYAVPGALPAGSYVAAITTVDADGRESGASEAVPISINVASGIRVTGLPSGKTARIYLSAPDGTTLFMVAVTGADHYDVTLPGYASGKPLDTQFLMKPPPGRIIRHFNGRLYIADALGTVWFTEPYAPDLVHRARGFFQFPAPVTVMEPAGENGMWFVAEITEFYVGGGPEEFKPQVRLGYGAVYGTSQVLPQTKDAIWYSTRGVVMGTKDGQVTNLQEVNVAPDTGSAGALLVREQDGNRHAVVSVRDANVSPLASTSFIEMEVIRKAAP